ncbi:unnamed protein product [Allacma fusca]|uniref:Uncharacterized protein n=1 Tax=Allacma fusca TaxID=39272 RepID=A0A8J2JLG0_9HEXA|nr:unnamed protein product [Allacma fusca]
MLLNGAAVPTLYFVLSFYNLHPIESCLNLVIAMDSILFFVAMYDDAFQLPTEMEKLKLVNLEVNSQEGVRRNSRIWKISRSIPNIAIRVGRFRNLERTSTPEFVDFVLRNLVGLLLASRK